MGKIWEETPLTEKSKGVYEATLAAPAEGWTAHLVELTFAAGPDGTPIKFTTPVKVLPETLPFEYELPAEAPKGYLSN